MKSLTVEWVTKAESDYRIVRLAATAVPSEFGNYKSDFLRLDEYSAEIRYPGDYASEQDASDALVIVDRLRTFIRAKLGLDQPATPEGN